MPEIPGKHGWEGWGAREMMKGSKKEREEGGKVRRNKQKYSVNPQEKALTCFYVAIVADPAG